MPKSILCLVLQPWVFICLCSLLGILLVLIFTLPWLLCDMLKASPGLVVMFLVFVSSLLPSLPWPSGFITFVLFFAVWGLQSSSRPRLRLAVRQQAPSSRVGKWSGLGVIALVRATSYSPIDAIDRTKCRKTLPSFRLLPHEKQYLEFINLSHVKNGVLCSTRHSIICRALHATVSSWSWKLGQLVFFTYLFGGIRNYPNFALEI